MVFFMHGHLYSKNGLQTRLTANVCRPFFCFICGYETLSGSQYVITGGSSFACAIIFFNLTQRRNAVAEVLFLIHIGQFRLKVGGDTMSEFLYGVYS